jgi:hypothetical protein
MGEKKNNRKIKCNLEKPLPVAEITIAEGQTQRPSNPFCVLGEFQTGFILGEKQNGKNSTF